MPRSRFNLITETPPPRLRLPALSSPQMMAGGLVGLIILSLGGINLKQLLSLRHYQNEKQTVESQLARFSNVVQEVERLDAERKRLSQQKGLIQQLESERLRYPKLLETIAALLPARLWLGRIATTSQASTILLSIDATAFDNYAVADLLSNLEKYPEVFSTIILGGINAAGGATPESSTVSFRVSATYTPPKEGAPKG